MELLDVVDRNGNPTGETVSRDIARAEGVPHRTSHVWLVRVKDERLQILLQKRSNDKDSHPGCYDISSAGHIPAGVDFIPSALRELEEEQNANTLQVKTKNIKIKYSKIKKKKQKIAAKKAFVVSGAQGSVTYKVAKYDKKAKKKITVSKAGKVTVKKGLKRGTYKIKVNVTAAGNAAYLPATKTVILIEGGSIKIKSEDNCIHAWNGSITVYESQLNLKNNRRILVTSVMS